MKTTSNQPHLYAFSVADNHYKDLGPASRLDRFLAHLSPHLTTNPLPGLVEKKAPEKKQTVQPFASDQFER